MYFANNPPLATLSLQIAQELDDLHAARPALSMHLIALVDCAFDLSFLERRYRRTSRPLSLYANTALQAFGTASPHLFSSPHGESEPLAWLNHLFADCGSKPMLSFIASPLNADELARHMRPYLIAMTPDTVEWPVRWGDTRVLPVMLNALTKTQREHFLAPVARWWLPGRDGSMRSWDGAASAPVPSGFDKLPLTDLVFTTLVDAAEADSVLAQLYDSQPDLCQAHKPSECHARVVRCLELASKNGITASPAREHFSALALLLVDGIEQQVAIVELLRRTRQGADYFKEIASLPDEFWLNTAR